MKVTTIPAKEVSADLLSQWSALQRADSAFDSAYFRPEFMQAVAAVRTNVEVAVLEVDQKPVGFFPFHRSERNIGSPIGGRMCDFQGVVLQRGVTLDPMDLVRGCRLLAWHFDHVITTQTAFEPFHFSVQHSPLIDTSQGYDAYYKSRRAAGSETLSKMARKVRKLEREIGPARFELDTHDDKVLETLFEWKGEYYRELGYLNLFKFEWTKGLLRELWHSQDDACRGLLSAWYINDELGAVHYGILSRGVLHSWFPTYRTDWQRHSPGSQLLIQLIKAAGSLGIQRIDLGKGSEPYKQSFMTGTSTVWEGSVDTRVTRRTLRRIWHHTRRRVRDSALAGPATKPWGVIRRVRDQIQFR